MTSPGTVRRRLRLGMVGGGPGSFIGPVHRIAARLDDRYEVVAGALSSNPERARQGGAEAHFAPDRSYETWQAMVEGERNRPDRIDVVAIVTPNNLHYGPAKAFMEAGFDVVCDKPLTMTVAEAEDLVETRRRTGRLFAVTHTYAGYPMVRQARALVAAGALGPLRLVNVEYVQSWLTESLEATGNRQAAWRVDPAQSGAGGCLGDIGTHAYHLAGFVSGMVPEALCADLTSFGPGRQLDDNVHLMLRYPSGARGHDLGQPCRTRQRQRHPRPGLWRARRAELAPGTPGRADLHPLRRTAPAPGPRRTGLPGIPTPYVPRGPSGHPEGYLEAFAQLYTDVAEQIAAREEGREPSPDSLLVATVEEGAAGMRFVRAALESSRQGGLWLPPG